MAAALARGRYRTDSLIDATPFRVAHKTIGDKHDLGTIDLSEALARSSNVAMAKIALSLEPAQMHDTLRALGFGEVTASGFPGESAGLMSSADHWRPIGIATMAYGYGLSVTPLQLTQGYAILGAEGMRRPITFRHVQGPVPETRVLSEKVARDLISLLEQAVMPAGTGVKAAVPGYRVAGKTGTAWKASAGGFHLNRGIFEIQIAY